MLTTYAIGIFRNDKDQIQPPYAMDSFCGHSMIVLIFTIYILRVFEFEIKLYAPTYARKFWGSTWNSFLLHKLHFDLNWQEWIIKGK